MMKKRLRKKKHLREFAQHGRQVIITRNRKDGFDDFLDAFIEETIEANACYCGGGGKEDKLDVIVELRARSENPDAKLKEITGWLGARPDVKDWKVGQEFDLWHGDFVDMKEETEQVNQGDGE